MSVDTTEFVLTEKGFILRTTQESPITNAEQLITNCLGSVGSTISHLAPELHFRQANNYVWVASRLPSLTIRSNFVLSKDKAGLPIVVPTYGGVRDGAFPLAPEWTPPDCMHLYLISMMNADSKYGMLSGFAHTCYFAAFDMSDGKKGQFLLPLPNIYPDGKVCMGSAWDIAEGIDAVSTRGYLPRHAAAVKSFMASSWNSDLAGNKEALATELFHFTGDGKQVTPPANSFDYCTKVGNLNIDWVYSILKATP